jgi:superfamily II DNA/RNA helicase
VIEVDILTTQMKIPDLWQQQAVQALLSGKDVVVDAPTGAGKTFIFELLLQSGFRGQSVFTVPTRALANDKRREWKEAGWRVGITTGDLSEDPQAPVVVATLETQKSRFLHEDGPDLLVIDEYQMLADPSRGVNYELILALAPPRTRLLLLSGSVANPQIIVQWLQNLGRSVALVQHKQRPVPLEEVFVESIKAPKHLLSRSTLVNAVQRALLADLAPILVFAPKRQSAESLALQLANELPNSHPLELSPEQQRIAGEPLGRLLRNRIAYHHSGLDYLQRGGLVEPLAKNGQLRVVVATLGLASGINFSMRSVLISDIEYRSEEASQRVRPDELLQMFGRAGRRGLDSAGAILVLPESPRLGDAHPLHLQRTTHVDWPSLLAVMQAAVARKKDPIEASRKLRQRLFRPEEVALGWQSLTAQSFASSVEHSAQSIRTRKEFLNTSGEWERLRPMHPTPLQDCLLWIKNEWRPAYQHPDGVRDCGEGRPCILLHKPVRIYGKEIPIASWSTNEHKGDLLLTKWLRFRLRQTQNSQLQALGKKRFCSLEEWTGLLQPALESLLPYGKLHAVVERNQQILLHVDHRMDRVLSRIDHHGKALLNPDIREVEVEETTSFGELAGLVQQGASSLPVIAWAKLGLIDPSGKPTRRGSIFSYFQHGDGLAIAAALEDSSYDFSSLVYDLANIRGGHRFAEFEGPSAKLGIQCRLRYGSLNYKGYLRRGLPFGYGEGVAEVIRTVLENSARRSEFTEGELRIGDIERAMIEWKNLLLQVANSPDYPWDRWQQFQQYVQDFLQGHRWQSPATLPLPALTYAQRTRPHLRLSPSDFR